MATENIMMESVQRGCDRQEIHEIIRVYSHKAALDVKMNGKPNNLIDLIASDERIPLNKEEILSELKPEKYIGRCVSQIKNFNKKYADPVIEKYYSEDIKSELSV